MAAEKTYRLGKRFRILRDLAMIAVACIVFCFYFIYQSIMVPAFPWLGGTTLVAIFLALGVIFVSMISWLAGKMCENFSYVLTDNGLEIRNGKRKSVLAWKDFEKAQYGSLDPFPNCPVHYVVKGAQFKPNQNLENLWQMNQEIVRRIRPYAEIELGLEKKIQAFIK